VAQLGKYNVLRVVKRVDFGLYLDGGTMGEILMPRRYVRADMQIGDEVEVFVYLDGEERYVATTEEPYAVVGEFAYLKVNKVENVGAFCDWGVLKELLVPFREQKVKMEEGKSYVIYIYIDPMTDRIAGTMKLDKVLHKTPPTFAQNEAVDLLIWSQTDIGYKAIINSTHLGVLYKNELHQKLSSGQKIQGYIRKVREDGKIDLSLQPMGVKKVDPVSERILNLLNKSGGSLPYHDKTDPEVISKIFGVSKKTFKQSIGALYKQRLIEITEKGIKKL
jgi:uncharacterized protein